MLVDLDEEGNLVTRPFDNTASEEMTQGSRRSTNSNPDQEFDEEDEDYDQDEDDPDIEDIEGKHSLF